MSTSKRKKEQRQAALKKKSSVQKREKELQLASKLKNRSKEFSDYVPTESYRRSTPEYQSLKTTHCDTSKRESGQYTGDYIQGIAVMHKSNLVPVSRGIDAEDYATMRR